MPRKFLPRFIENEPTTETEIRQQLAVEKFKNEIALLQSRSRRHEQRFKNLDSEMVAHITSKFKEKISARIIKQWEEACRKEESKSIEIYNNKQEDWIDDNVSSGFRNNRTNGSNVKGLGKPRGIRNNVTNRNSNAEDQAAKDQRGPFFGDFGGRSRSGSRRQNRGRGNGRNRPQCQGRQQRKRREENRDNSQQVRLTRRNEGIRNRTNTLFGFFIVSKFSFSFILFNLLSYFQVPFIFLRVSAKMARNRGRVDSDVSNLNNPVLEIPGKLLLVVNSIDKGNDDTQDLMQLLIEEVKSLRVSYQNLPQQHKDLVESLAPSTESKMDACTREITQGIINIEERPKRERDLRFEVTKARSTLETLWQNMINTRKQAFFDYYHAERMQESYQKFLACNPPKMPRKFPARFIENEPTTETEIRQQLAVEKFKNEIALLQSHSRRYNQRVKN